MTRSLPGTSQPVCETQRVLAGDRSPDGVQDFLARDRWNADAVRDELRAYVVTPLDESDAVLVLDETGFVKKGEHSAGVQRQYSGTAGRIGNCAVGVFLTYASRRGYAFIDRALYLPESWAQDVKRRRQAHIPDTVAFHTKAQIGQMMLERALAAGVPFAWVAADSVYGSTGRLRRRILAWSRWRRRHQQRAKPCHWTTRTRRQLKPRL